MKLNKTNLSKLIKWRYSKFNEYTKNEVIAIVLNLKPFEEFQCRCGSYGEKAWNGGVSYHFRTTSDKLLIKISDNRIEVLEE